MHTDKLVHSQKGFSLIELLIVCALLTILLALALPNLTSSKRAAREQTAKGKLAAIGAQQTSFKTLLGKRRYGALSELQAATAGGSPLLTAADTSVPDWTFSDVGTATTTTFGVKVEPTSGNPANYSFAIFEDQVLRRCARGGPWSKADCTQVNE
jgi:prepilin-type N-terminal cleavage/methylation domain-containing protein